MLRRMLAVLGVVVIGLAETARAQDAYPYPEDGEQGDAASGGDQSQPQEDGQVYTGEEGQAGAEVSADVSSGVSGQAAAEVSAGASADVSVDIPTPEASVNFETFHSALAPYGEWVTVAPYGRVWRPARVQAGWRPYYYGHWEWTDEGWLWASDEPWGWAPYHYGRWTASPAFGWVWVPGYQWAPAWVSWRYSGAVVGWAPLLPGFSVYLSTVPSYYTSYYTYVPFRHFVGVPVHSVAYSHRYAGRIFHDTRPAPPRAVFRSGVVAPAWGGPARHYAEQRIGRPIATARILPVSSPSHIRSFRGRGGIPIYRPGGHVATRPGPARPGPNRPRGSSGWNRPSGPSGGAHLPVRRQGIAPMPGSHRSAPGYSPGGGDYWRKKKPVPYRQPGQPAGGYRGSPGGGGGHQPMRPQGRTFAPYRGGAFVSQGGASHRSHGGFPEKRIRHR